MINIFDLVASGVDGNVFNKENLFRWVTVGCLFPLVYYKVHKWYSGLSVSSLYRFIGSILGIIHKGIILLLLSFLQPRLFFSAKKYIS